MSSDYEKMGLLSGSNFQQSGELEKLNLTLTQMRRLSNEEMRRQ